MLTRTALLLATAATLAAASACARIHAMPVQDFVTIADPVVALTNVRVIDGTGQHGRPGQTIILKNGLTRRRWQLSSCSAAAGARVIDLGAGLPSPAW